MEITAAASSPLDTAPLAVSTPISFALAHSLHSSATSPLARVIASPDASPAVASGAAVVVET